MTPEPRRPTTPDTATWNERVDVDIELLGDRDSLDEVDVVDESWAPGQGRPGLPADEILHVHTDVELMESASELDLDDIAEDEIAIATDDRSDRSTD